MVDVYSILKHVPPLSEFLQEGAVESRQKTFLLCMKQKPTPRKHSCAQMQTNGFSLPEIIGLFTDTILFQPCFGRLTFGPFLTL